MRIFFFRTPLPLRVYPPKKKLYIGTGNFFLPPPPPVTNSHLYAFVKFDCDPIVPSHVPLFVWYKKD